MTASPPPIVAVASPVASPAASAVPAGPQNAAASEGFGDFGGGRSALAKKGFVVRGHYVAEAAGDPTGGLQQGTAYASELMLGTDIDLAKAVANSGLGAFHVTLTEREGSSLSQNALGNILTVQEIYGNGLQPHITEASYDQPLLGDKIDLSFGRVITENDFADAPTYWGGNLYCEYQSNAICGTPIAAPIDSGYVPYPSSEWGARLRGNPTKNFYVETAFYEVNPLRGTPGHGLSLGLAGDTGVYLPFEVGLKLTTSDGSTLGDLRAGGYDDTSVVKEFGSNLARFDTNDEPTVGALAVPSFRGRSGAWLQLDRVIDGSGDVEKRGTVAFLTAEYGDPQTSLISAFLDGGVVRHGTFAGRTDDTIALGYAYADVNARLRALETQLQARGDTRVPITGQEQIFEANYGVQLLPYAVLRPGAQYVLHPSGNAAIKSALVLDLSTTIAF